MSIVEKIIGSLDDEKPKTVNNEMSIWMNENITIEYVIFKSRDYFVLDFAQVRQLWR
jgi:hypothetical protein